MGMTGLPHIGSAAAVSEGEAPVLVVPMGADRAPGPGAEYVLDQLGPWVGEHLEGVGFSGKPGEVAVIPTGGGLRYSWVVLVGVGDDPDHETVRRASATAFRAAPRAERVVTTVHQLSTPGALAATVEGSLLAGYRYENYRSEPSEHPLPEVVLASPLPADWMEVVERSQVVAEAVAAARDWVNQPALDQGPADLAALMSAVAVEAGMTVEIWDEERLREERMGGILSVGRGSHRPPRLLRLLGPGDGPRLTLVGKGITFDSGGLSLKSATAMEGMKTDMAGAATAAAAGAAISRLGLDVRVEVLAALAENMPGGRASRPRGCVHRPQREDRGGAEHRRRGSAGLGRRSEPGCGGIAGPDGRPGHPDRSVQGGARPRNCRALRNRGCQENRGRGGRGGGGEGLAAPPSRRVPQVARLAGSRHEECGGSVGWSDHCRPCAQGIHR